MYPGKKEVPEKRRYREGPLYTSKSSHLGTQLTSCALSWGMAGLGAEAGQS